MKESLLIFFILISVNVFSQVQDTIILKTGEIIPCQIDKISKSGVVTYYYVDSNGFSVMSMTGKSLIKEIKSMDSLYPVQKTKYQTWISLYNAPYNMKGMLYKIEDSSILFAQHTLAYDFNGGRLKMADLSINNVEAVKVRRKGKIGLWSSVGAITGFTAGWVIGKAITPNHQDGLVTPVGLMESAGYGVFTIGLGIGLGIGGAAIGAAIGSVKIKIPINGSRANFNMEKSRLKKYSLK